MLKNILKWLSNDKPGEAAPVENATTFVRSSDPQVIATLGGSTTSAGFSITPDTSMRVSAVFAAVRLLSGAIGCLPVEIYREADGKREAINPELWWLLNEQPIANWAAIAMWEWVMKSILLRGDGFVEIVRRGADVKALRPLHPDCVGVNLVGDYLIYTVVDPQTGAQRVIHQDDMLHFPGFGFNGTRGMSVIQWAAHQAIGVALAADTFSGAFFANGAAPKHLIKSPGRLSEDQVQGIRNEYKSKYAGANNAGLPMVLTQGLDITEMSMTNDDAQLLDSRKFQVIDIARAFGVPPHMIGAQETTSSWGSGVEQMTIGFVKFSLQPYIVRIRQELNRKLFRRASPFIEHKLEALMRGDSKAEGEYMRQVVGGSMGPGVKTINEVRRDMNLPPIDGGNVLYNPVSQDIADPKTTKGSDEEASPTDSK